MSIYSHRKALAQRRSLLFPVLMVNRISKVFKTVNLSSFSGLGLAQDIGLEENHFYLNFECVTTIFNYS